MCACGRPFNVKDELAGKNVRCPACQQVVNVPVAVDTLLMPVPTTLPTVVAATEVLPTVVAAPQGAPRPAGDPPARRKKVKLGLASKTNATWYAMAGVGLFVGCLCLGGCGFVGFSFFFTGVGDPEQAIVGRWQNVEPYKNVRAGKEILEFNADGTFAKVHDNPPDDLVSLTDGTWKVVRKDGRNLTVEVSYVALLQRGPGMQPIRTPMRETYFCTIHNKTQMDRDGIAYKRM
jgi:hypothetical protein